MISSKNIGILLKIIKNSKGKKILYLVIKNKSIKKSNLKEYNIKISKKLIIYKFRINHFYKSILEILVPIIFNNNKLVLGQLGQSIDGRINKQVYNYLNIKSSIKLKRSFGGTSPSEVKKQIKLAKKRFLKI